MDKEKIMKEIEWFKTKISMTELRGMIGNLFGHEGTRRIGIFLWSYMVKGDPMWLLRQLRTNKNNNYKTNQN